MEYLSSGEKGKSPVFKIVSPHSGQTISFAIFCYLQTCYGPIIATEHLFGKWPNETYLSYIATILVYMGVSAF